MGVNYFIIMCRYCVLCYYGAQTSRYAYAYYDLPCHILKILSLHPVYCDVTRLKIHEPHELASTLS